MSTAQHAANILEAWKVKNPANFNGALDKALVACKNSLPTWPLEAEREELLRSVVEHIQQRDNPDQLPEYSDYRAVALLLQHLSSRRAGEEKSDSVDEKLPSKNVKFGSKRAKWSTESRMQPTRLSRL